MAIRCVVVTPERTELDREAESVVLPMFDGELGVLCLLQEAIADWPQPGVFAGSPDLVWPGSHLSWLA